VSTCLHVLVKIVDRGRKVKTDDDCIITAPFHTRRDDDQLHAKFVIYFHSHVNVQLMSLT
jgi:hypothetical protein